jgi:hypothetical protein
MMTLDTYDGGVKDISGNESSSDISTSKAEITVRFRKFC